MYCTIFFFLLDFLTANHAQFNRKTNRNKENYTVSRTHQTLHRLWLMSMMCMGEYLYIDVCILCNAYLSLSIYIAPHVYLCWQCMSVFAVFNLLCDKTVLHLFSTTVDDCGKSNTQLSPVKKENGESGFAYNGTKWRKIDTGSETRFASHDKSVQVHGKNIFIYESKFSFLNLNNNSFDFSPPSNEN